MCRTLRAGGAVMRGRGPTIAPQTVHRDPSTRAPLAVARQLALAGKEQPTPSAMTMHTPDGIRSVEIVHSPHTTAPSQA